MTKEEFWEKWTKDAFGSHIPIRLLQKKEEFLNDLDFMMLERNMSSVTATWSSSPNVPDSMLGFGHKWVWPDIIDNFQTAYCVCSRCGIDSEQPGCEEICKGEQNE